MGPKLIEKDGFLFRENEFGLSLLLNEKKIDSSSKYVKKHHITSLEINGQFGYNLDNLDMLSHFENIKHLGIGNHTINIDGIKYLKNLETYNSQDQSNQKHDFSQFKNLTRCHIHWRRSSESIYECKNLQHLSIVRYPEVNLQKLNSFNNLISIGLENGKLETLEGPSVMPSMEYLNLGPLRRITSLNGIEAFPNLKKIDLWSLSSLIDLNAVECLNGLEYFNIESCKKINDISAYSKLKKLKGILLDNCEDIKSLTPLSVLKHLERVHFIESTKILDGNLTPLVKMNLKSIRFQERKFYTNNRKDFE